MSKLSFGIRQRVLIVALLPLLIITLMLGGYFINTQLNDAHDALMEKGKTIGKLLASSSEFGLLTGNQEILNGLIYSATKSQEVADIAFLDTEFNIVAAKKTHDVNFDNESAYPLFIKQHAYFLHPVVTTGVDVLDTDGLDENGQDEIIGWVVTILSQQPTQKRQQEILIKGIILAFIGFLFTLFIASRFGQRITHPILGLTRVIEQLQKGNLNTRANISSTGELHLLAQGINRMAQRVQESNQNLEGKVNKATYRLRSTLVHLEQQNQALDLARKNADNANLAKDEFLARMSHELRTPLTSVSGFTRLLDQTALQPEQKEYTRIINLTSELLLSIIDDILDYSKLESNAIELERIPFSIENCVLDVLEMQAAAAHEKGLELIPVLPPEIPRTLIGDPIRMRQILTNLVSNAVKFTQQGNVSIQLELKQQNSEKLVLLITVTDTGTGIPQDRIKNLFHAFSQADTSITRKFGGSGLGLVIAKKLTELMLGRIKLNSVLGEGTQVELEIPFQYQQETKPVISSTLSGAIIYNADPILARSIKYQANAVVTSIIKTTDKAELTQLCQQESELPVIWNIEAGAIDAKQVKEIEEFAKQFSNPLVLLSTQPLPLLLPHKILQLRKPFRSQLLLNALSPESFQLPRAVTNNELALKDQPSILVAEDNEFNRLLLNKILSKAGANVIEASNGEEAVNQAQQQKPDIILMDVHMPIMDGIEATKQIRLTARELPIIALTANVISSEHQKLIESGIDKVLLKPINDIELNRTLQHYLGVNNHLNTEQEHKETKSQLEKYDINHELLLEELQKQLSALQLGLSARDIKQMRHHSHQLIGLAGLYELPELEAAGNKLHEMLLEERLKPIWHAFHHLKRTIDTINRDGLF